MKKVINYGASIRARLLAIAKKVQLQLEYLLLRYALERFLYRLGVSPYANQFVLKGASIFTIWIGPFCRVTRDADVEALCDANPLTLIEIFKEICCIQCLEDATLFDLDSFVYEEIKKEDKYPGTRIRFNATVGGARVTLQFDIGVGDSIYPVAETMAYPSILDLPTPRLKTYPRYTVVAEKFSTMIFRGMLNSRVKDYYDLWLLAKTFAFEGSILQEAIYRTFKRRNLEIPKMFPEALTHAFLENINRLNQWKAFIKTLGNAPMPNSFEEAILCLQTFLSPLILQGTLENSIWDPIKQKWLPCFA
jgi:hypothetical protein